MLRRNKSLALNLEKALFYVLLFLIPTQLSLHFWPPFSFVFGIRVDFLAVSIYLTDLIILALIFIWFFLRKSEAFRKLKNNRLSFLVFFIISCLNIVFSTAPVLSFIKWVHILALFLFALYLSESREIFSEKIIGKIIYFSLLAFSLVGISQFFLGRTIGGVLYYFGERTFSISTPGIALFNFFGREVLRAYSTFSHPNSFAGYLGASFLFLIFSKHFKNLPLRVVGLTIILLAFILAFSFSAFISIAAVFVLFLLQKRFKVFNKFSWVFLVLIIGASLVQLLISADPRFYLRFPNDKYSQRLELSYIAGKMVSEKFLVGEGMNTFIFNLPRFKSPAGYAWFLQPVHNIYLLFVSETGILGLVTFFIFMNSAIRKIVSVNNYQIFFPLIFILITGLFDHYWFTLQQNMLFVFFLFSYFI